MSNPTKKCWTLGEIEYLIQAFENCTLPHSRWTHHAHLIVALWYLTHYSYQEATHLIRNGIQRYNRAIGFKMTKDGSYHETMMLFWVQIVYQYLMKQGNNHSIVDLVNGLFQHCVNPLLPLEYPNRDWLNVSGSMPQLG